MKLTVFERIKLQNLLPKQGDFLALSVIRQLLDELQFSDDEIERASIENLPNGQIKWTASGAESVIKDCHIGKPAEAIIIAELKKLDAQKKLGVDQMPLYEKFVLSKEAPVTPEESGE